MRDPVDTCVSCFSRLFTEGQTFSYDLAELGRYYRWYHELMAHWRSVLPAGAMLDVAYEDVVDNLEAASPAADRLLRAPLGRSLPELSRNEPADRDLPATSRFAGRSIAARSQRWRRYEAYLQPLLAELESCREPSARVQRRVWPSPDADGHSAAGVSETGNSANLASRRLTNRTRPRRGGANRRRPKAFAPRRESNSSTMPRAANAWGETDNSGNSDSGNVDLSSTSSSARRNGQMQRRSNRWSPTTIRAAARPRRQETRARRRLAGRPARPGRSRPAAARASPRAAARKPGRRSLPSRPNTSVRRRVVETVHRWAWRMASASSPPPTTSSVAAAGWPANQRRSRSATPGKSSKLPPSLTIRKCTTFFSTPSCFCPRRVQPSRGSEQKSSSRASVARA